MSTKLIEIALPLDDINRACEAETKIKVGKPTQVHHYWARRPLAVCRACCSPSSSTTHPPTPTSSRRPKRRRLSGSGCSTSSVSW